jgi:indolepyruvate decarboxylase
MPNVADYVARRLEQLGVKVLFGVPAFYCFPLFDAAPRHNIETVVNSSDLEAGYAADGYAKVHGLGAVSVAYGVGTLSLANAVAGAYVERSPLVVLNGGPTVSQIADVGTFGVLYSHSIGRDATDLKVFEQITELAVRIDNVNQVSAVVDRALTAAITKKRPVYIEIAQNLWTINIADPGATLRPVQPVAGREAELARQILQLIKAAQRPALLLGVELQRFGLADPTVELINKLPARCAWATTVLAKSVIPESVPRFVGVCDRESGPAHMRLAAADRLVALGCVFPTGYRNLVRSSASHMVRAANGLVKIDGGQPVPADLGLLVAELNRQAPMVLESEPVPPASRYDAGPPSSRQGATAAALTHTQLFIEVEAILDESWIVVADTFLGIHAASELKVKGRDAFLCNAVWASIGHSVGAAVGAALAAGRRPLVVCGDGGFQMTAQACSTMAARNLRPVVIVVGNGLYGYEQFLIDRTYYENPSRPPKPYAKLSPWNYTALARAMGFTSVFDVNTPAALRAALTTAKAFNGPSLIAAAVDPRDLPSALE